MRSGLTGCQIGIETEFVAADVEADVEGFVEVGLLLECGRVPRLGAAQVRDFVDDGAQALDHDGPDYRVI